LDQPAIPMHIWRPLHPVDQIALRALLADCVPFDGEPTPRQIGVHDMEQDTIAAVDNAGRVAAYALLSHNEQHFYELQARVHPDYRGRGVGRYLLAWAAGRAQVIAAKMIYTYPARDDEAARRLLKRAGYRSTDGHFFWRDLTTPPA